MNVYKKDNKFIFEIETEINRINPYMEDEDCGKYPTLTGLIIKHRGNNDYDEIGFAHTIDMDYKDKPD